MKKPEILILLISIVGTALVSTILGLAGSSIHGPFWSWFWISFVLQIIGFSVWNSILIQKQTNFIDQAEIAALEQLSKFTIGLSCAYCNQSNEAQIQLNQKNTFKCESCNQVNGIYMQFTATTLTTPIESLKLPLPNSKEVAEIRVSN